MIVSKEDLGLSEQEVQELVTGAQKFLAPAADPRDEERLTDREPSTPLNYGTND